MYCSTNPHGDIRKVTKLATKAPLVELWFQIGIEGYIVPHGDIRRGTRELFSLFTLDVGSNDGLIAIALIRP